MLVVGDSTKKRSPVCGVESRRASWNASDSLHLDSSTIDEKVAGLIQVFCTFSFACCEQMDNASRLVGYCNSIKGIRVGEELASCGAKPGVGNMSGVYNVFQSVGLSSAAWSFVICFLIPISSPWHKTKKLLA